MMRQRRLRTNALCRKHANLIKQFQNNAAVLKVAYFWSLLFSVSSDSQWLVRQRDWNEFFSCCASVLLTLIWISTVCDTYAVLWQFTRSALFPAWATFGNCLRTEPSVSCLPLEVLLSNYDNFVRHLRTQPDVQMVPRWYLTADESIRVIDATCWCCWLLYEGTRIFQHGQLNEPISRPNQMACVGAD